MRLRITKITDGTVTLLHIDGELLGEGVHELERAAIAPRPLRLDLTYLLRTDADGIAALRQLSTTGAELVNVPPYVALLLAS